MKKIIIDTDPGIDDTMAIYFALNSPELEVIGLTTVYGNTSNIQGTENALRILENS
jgi:inosine-uridine nucleoside N-ribohydrolase